MIYKRCIFLRFEVKQHVSALYGHHQVLSIEVLLYKLRVKGCDVEISHQNYNLMGDLHILTLFKQFI